MASRVVETKLLLTGEDQASRVLREVAKATGSVTKALSDVAKVGKTSAEVDRLTKSLERTSKAAAEFSAFRKALAEVASTEATLKLARARLTEVGKALDGAKKAADAYASTKGAAASAEVATKAAAAAKEVSRLTAEHKAAEREARALQSVMKAQTREFEAARSAVRAYGVPIQDAERHQQALQRSIDRTTRAIREQQAAELRAAAADARRAATEERRLQRHATRREALGVAVGAAGVVAAHRGKEVMWESVRNVKEFDDAQKRQIAYTGITEQDQKPLLEQAKKIGQETPFSNTDVVQAQTTAMQGLPDFSSKVKAEVAEGILDNVRNYSTLMETSLKEGAETIRSYLQSTGKDISTKEKALAEANKAVNQIVMMSKLGGMSGEDAAQYVKYAAASSTTAGLPTEATLAMGALARRGGLRGDEAGVFMRATASKLVSPTKKGRAALNAVGINFDNYVKMPDRLDTAALENQFKGSLGKTFTPEVRKRIDEINRNKDLIKDQESYTAAIVEAAGPILGKKKDGTVRGSDSKAAAKAVGDFYGVSGVSVESFRLLQDAMSKNMTLQQLNAWLTDKHGGKGAITQKQWDAFKSSFAEIGAAGDDPDFAKKKTDYIMSGVSGSLENLHGSWENFTLEIGRANEGLIKFTADGLGRALDSFSKLDPATQQIVSLGGAAATAALGVAGFVKVAGGLLGSTALTGSATALTGSAAQLAASAAALDAAAAKLGMSGPAGVAEKASKILPAASVAGAMIPWTSLLAPAAIAGAGTVGSFHGNAVAGAQLKRGLDRRKAEREGTDIPFLQADLAKVRGELAENERRAAEIGDDMDRAPVLMALRSRKTALEASIRDIEAKIAARLKSDPIDLGLDALSAVARPGGHAVGEAAGKGIADGVKSKAPDVLEEGKALFKRMKDVFDSGIPVPLRFAPEGGQDFGGLNGGLVRASLGGSAYDRSARSIGRSEGGGWAIRETPGAGRAGGGEAGRERSGPVAALPVDDGPGAGHVAPREERAAYIREAARKRGIDPETALRVAQSEGFNDYTGDQGRSFGDWQLFTGGGLGNVAQDQGIDVRDPRTWKEQTEFALDHAAKNGWGPWHGARRAGIGDWQGIGAANPPAGTIDLSGMATRRRRGPLDDVEGFVVHHTGGRGDAAGVLGTLNCRGLGVQWVIGRDGRRYQTLPDGERGAHMRPSDQFPDATRPDLSNRNTVGVEVIAKDDKDVTPAQIEASKRLFDDVRKRWPKAQVYGHGELNPGHKQETEGKTIRDAIREGLIPPTQAKAPEPPAPSLPPIPSAPEGGIGGAMNWSDMQRAADRMHDAAGRIEQMRLNAMLSVELSGPGREQARVRGMKAFGDGPVRADLGVSMPQIRSTRVG